MGYADDQHVAQEIETGMPVDFDTLVASTDLDRRVQAGEITGEQAAELIQQAARRHVAENGPTLDTDEEGRITTGGFGSGHRQGT